MLTRNRRSKKTARPGTWKLQDAKAHFSEVVRRARTDGPQRVTVHGKDAVVVVATEDYANAQASQGTRYTGTDFIAAMRQAGKLGLKLKPSRVYPIYRPPVSFVDDER